MTRRIATLAMAFALLLSCTTERKLSSLRKIPASAEISPVVQSELPELAVGQVHRDTLHVTGEDGRELLILRAIKDEHGEMVATDVLQAAKVTARFRNVAERHGKVDISFDVTVPPRMQDQRWQLRLNPDLFVMEDSIRLEPIVITGAEYREAQLRGYEQYERFLSRIVTDSTLFLRAAQLDCFVKRNIPELYKYRRDTGYVTDNEFYSHFGVSEQEAIDHYRKKLMMRLNDRRIGKKDIKFRRLVPDPIVTSGLRLDSVVRNTDDELVYRYTQTIATRPGLKKADVVLGGEIQQMGRKLYDIPRCAPLTFYISSLSFFADNTEKYKTEVIGRKVEANTACYIDFEKGSWILNPSLGENSGEISRIKGNIASLLENEKFDMDSILVTASCSPEGSVKLNGQLSEKRSAAVSDFFQSYVRQCMDSLRKEVGVVYDLAGIGSQTVPDIKMISRSDGENWRMLDALVEKDTVLTKPEKEAYSLIARIKNPDDREAALQGEAFYPRLRQSLYPRLRTVRFDFFMHRKGMVKDTIHTTTLDTVYMGGVHALRDRDYKKAVSILRPYDDYNTAVAYCAMDYNASALAVLRKLEKSDKVDYLMAIIYSRTGEDEKAVQHYLDACAADRMYVSRGNLDPEISELIRRYGLNKEDDMEL